MAGDQAEAALRALCAVARTHHVKADAASLRQRLGKRGSLRKP